MYVASPYGPYGKQAAYAPPAQPINIAALLQKAKPDTSFLDNLLQSNKDAHARLAGEQTDTNRLLQQAAASRMAQRVPLSDAESPFAGGDSTIVPSGVDSGGGLAGLATQHFNPAQSMGNHPAKDVSPGHASGQNAQYERMMQQVAEKYGWGSGPQWEALDRTLMRESGFNPNAYNPSGAYGIGQFMPGTWADTGITRTSDPAAQMQAVIKYIQGRYGNPLNAWASEVERGWY